MKLTNAFSLSMVEAPCTVEVREVSALEVRELLDKGFVSAIGHESTAAFLSGLLGLEVPVNRIMVKLDRGDQAVVAQLLQRLPEGAVLSADEILKVPLKFFLVTVGD